MDEQGENVSSKRVERFHGNVKFKNVSFGYKEGEYVLKNIDFEANKGRRLHWLAILVPEKVQ